MFAKRAGCALRGGALEKRQKPDLVLSNVMMPEFDGHGVLQALQQDPALAPVPFIFLTAKSEKEDFRDGTTLGADDSLTKPVTNCDLIQAIEARSRRSQHHIMRGFKLDFSSAEPLRKLGLHCPGTRGG